LRSLVELHDGKVEARSDGPGLGSTFTVRLPIAPPEWVQADRAVAHRDAAKTVVVVEDQSDARRMMQMLLESYGVRVYTAANGAEGAALIKRVRPDLALVDLGLPVMSGFDLARQLRGQRDAQQTRLVALSGYGQDADVQAALEAGFDEHLTKPPDPQQLERLVTAGDVATVTIDEKPAAN
jgi:CheY-like chemotaxis protein